MNKNNENTNTVITSTDMYGESYEIASEPSDTATYVPNIKDEYRYTIRLIDYNTGNHIDILNEETEDSACEYVLFLINAFTGVKKNRKASLEKLVEIYNLNSGITAKIVIINSFNF